MIKKNKIGPDNSNMLHMFNNDTYTVSEKPTNTV